MTDHPFEESPTGWGVGAQRFVRTNHRLGFVVSSTYPNRRSAGGVLNPICLIKVPVLLAADDDVNLLFSDQLTQEVLGRDVHGRDRT